MEESDATMTSLLDSVTEMKTIAPITTLSNITPAITGMTALFEVPTTSIVMDTNTEAITPASTTISPTVTTPSTVTTPAATLSLDEIFKQSETVPVVLPVKPAETVSATTLLTVPAVTTSMTDLGEHANEILSQTDKTVTVADPITTSAPLSPALTAATVSPLDAMLNALNENSIVPHAEIDNVLTMSSNEDTTRMASSTESKMDNGDKQVVALAAQTEPPKSQETKNEVDADGKSGCNSITTSFVVLSLAVLYVIV